MTPEALRPQAERTALRIILSNVVAQLVASHSPDPIERRARLFGCTMSANAQPNSRAAFSQATNGVR
jgi:hypothetical protein